MNKKLLVALSVIGIVAIGAYTYTSFSKQTPLKINSSNPFSENQTKEIPRITAIAENLEVPWALAFLPDQSLLVTERSGRVRLVTASGELLPEPLLSLEVVRKIQGEGGLHGITIHPEFEKNRFVYVYYTYENQGNQSLNRVARYTFEDNKLINEQIIVDRIPGALFHDGGRIKFGPDKYLYITTGDAQDPSLAQNTNSLAGKILRVTPDGQPAPGNTTNTLIYSYGHRNPQGITWDESGRLWETEHGQSTLDELNQIENGNNYGWPTIEGDETKSGLTQPIAHSGSSTWAPGGAAYLNGSIYFVGLRGKALYEAKLQDNNVTIKVHLQNEFGRLRDVIVGPDKMLYVTTSNRDGRGIPAFGDDKILRINPTKL